MRVRCVAVFGCSWSIRATQAPLVAPPTRGAFFVLWFDAMVCYRPLKVYRKPGGGIAFDSKEGYVDRPFEIGCGQCYGCRLQKAREWSLRCVHEASLYESNCFLTLTYDDDHLPSDLSVDVREWQRFAKRMRKKVGSFRFLHCGEYGDENLRPHYHALIFGKDFSKDRVLFKEKPNPLWTSETLSDLWPLGFSTIGNLTLETANYVSKYCLKKVTGREGKEFYGGRKPPYATMSRRPGLGAEWFERFQKDLYPSDECVVQGHVYRPPRYYDEKLRDEELKLLKMKRLRSLDRENCSEERLRVREKVAVARANFKARSVTC